MVILIMGVAGAGKTALGTALAEKLGWKFVDADDLHPAPNIQKMSAGIPLTDEDRWPWLERVHAVIEEALTHGQNLVLACSALKQSYRERLLISPKVNLVYVRGSYELIEARLRARQHHYMGPEMLNSQLDTLEEPQNAIIVQAEDTLEASTQRVRTALNI